MRKTKPFHSLVLAALLLAGLSLTACQSPVEIAAGKSGNRAVAVPATKRVVGYFVEWGIYAAALYRYATVGESPRGFDLGLAFK